MVCVVRMYVNTLGKVCICVFVTLMYNRWFQEPAVKRNWIIVVGAWFLVFLGIGEGGLLPGIEPLLTPSSSSCPTASVVAGIVLEVLNHTGTCIGLTPVSHRCFYAAYSVESVPDTGSICVSSNIHTQSCI